MHDRSARSGRGHPARRYRRLKPGPGRSPSAVESNQRQRIQQAMVDLVAEHGYAAVTVRQLARLAGVSTETFYERFDGKEDCFVATYAAIMERVRRGVAAARSPRSDRDTQLRRIFRGLCGELAKDAKATRVALVDAFSGGPAAIAAIRFQEGTLDEAIRASLDRREARVSPIAATWLAAGSLRAARTATLEGRQRTLRRQVDELVRWGMSYLGDAPLDAPPAERAGPAPRRRPPAPPGPGLMDRAGVGNDRELILAAVVKLARRDGYWGLTVPKVCRRAGVSRAAFNRSFDGLSDCYLAAVGDLAGRYFAGLAAAPGPGGDWVAGTCRGVYELCRTVAEDPDLARLTFIGIVSPGAAGMHRREELIGRLADGWRAAAPASAGTLGQLDGEATIAALWTAIERALVDGARPPRLEAATYAFLALAPAIGAGAAAEAASHGDGEIRNIAHSSLISQ